MLEIPYGFQQCIRVMMTRHTRLLVLKYFGADGVVFVDNDDNNGNCDKVFGLVFFFSMLWFCRGRTLTCVCVIWNWWIYIFCEMFPNEEKDDCDIIWNRGGVSAVDNGLHTKCTAFLYEMCYFSFIGRFGRQQW